MQIDTTTEIFLQSSWDDLKRKQTISGCFEVNCISSRNISSHHNLRDRFQRPTVQKSPCLPFFTHRAFWISDTISINTPLPNNTAHVISYGEKFGFLKFDELTNNIGMETSITQNAWAIQYTKKFRGWGAFPFLPNTSSKRESPLRSCALHAKNSSSHPREQANRIVVSILRGSSTQFSAPSPVAPSIADMIASTR